MRIEGQIIVCWEKRLSYGVLKSKHVTDSRVQGFDEFMNLVLDQAQEVTTKEGGTRRNIGKNRMQDLVKEKRHLIDMRGSHCQVESCFEETILH